MEIIVINIIILKKATKKGTILVDFPDDWEITKLGNLYDFQKWSNKEKRIFWIWELQLSIYMGRF